MRKDLVPIIMSVGLSKMIQTSSHVELLREQSAVSQQIYDIRNKLHMTREDLAEYSDLTAETIEDI